LQGGGLGFKAAENPDGSISLENVDPRESHDFRWVHSIHQFMLTYEDSSVRSPYGSVGEIGSYSIDEAV